MRWFLTAVAAIAVSGCAGFKAVERGQWRLVYVDSERRDAEALHEVVTLEAYEAEVSEGTRRGVEPPAGFIFPLLHEMDTISLKPGEVRAFRVDETTEAELFADGGGVELYWGPVEKKDEWKVDTGVTVRESMLYLRGTKPGTATVRLVRGPTTKDVPVKVKQGDTPH
jgi:hypothetical protein